VTGCAGFIGSHVADTLRARGDHVTGVDLLPGDHLQADLAEAQIEPLLEGVDVVFHLAGQPGVRSGWGSRYQLYLRNNLLATQRLLDAAEGRDGLRVVFASSSSVYGDSGTSAPEPLSPYGQTKLGAEQLCRIYRSARGLDTRVLRYFTVFGPRQRPDMAFTRFLAAALDNAPIAVFGDGGQTRDFTYVADAVAATLAAAEIAADDAALPIDVGGGSPASVMEVIQVIGELTGRKLDVRHLDAEPGEPRNTLADTSRARELLEFRPATSLAEGLAEQLAWLERSRAQAIASPVSSALD
jgi:nucleoside-diphosphate-sugar epimerase